MSFTKNDWGDDLIDARDIIDRHEELESDKLLLEEALEEAEEELESYDGEDAEDINILAISVENAKQELALFNTFEDDELDFLKDIVSQGENTSDWRNETLIHEDYFTEHIKQLIDDCYEMPKEFESGNWPWNNMVMDWESAAEEAKVDYTTIEADGQTYYIRST